MKLIFKTILYVITLIFGFSAVANKAQVEDYYVKQWVSQYGGKSEVKTRYGTRIDILTSEYAIEADFGRKWAEGIGQALHYAALTGKKPAVLLILEDNKKTSQQRYIDRFNVTNEKMNLNIRLFIIKATDYPLRRK